MRIGNAVEFPQVTDPPTPNADRQYLYFKSDGQLYTKKPDGSVAVAVQSTNTPTKNQALLWNGSSAVWAAQGTSFTFSNASFTTNSGGSQSILLGPSANVWKAIGALTFSATYSNGPPTFANVTSTVSAWGTLAMTGAGKVGPTASTVVANYPAAVGNTYTFTLASGDGVDTSNTVLTFTFINNRYTGLVTKTSAYTSTDINALTPELSNSGSKTFTLSPGAGQYIIFASRTALSTRTFTVGGFTGGFNAPETLAVVNSAGFSENYYVYRSTNANLGNTTVVVS